LALNISPGIQEDEDMASRTALVREYMALGYPMEITRDEFGYFVRVPDLPGCESSGESLEDAVTSIEEAKEAWIEAALSTGAAVPRPRGEDDYSGRFVIRVGPSVHRDLVRIAAAEGMSLNAFVSSVLARETGRSEKSCLAGLRAQC
jgi:antitoxin HicB